MAKSALSAQFTNPRMRPPRMRPPPQPTPLPPLPLPLPLPPPLAPFIATCSRSLGTHSADLFLSLLADTLSSPSLVLSAPIPSRVPTRRSGPLSRSPVPALPFATIYVRARAAFCAQRKEDGAHSSVAFCHARSGSRWEGASFSAPMKA
jgi:hypothetical protein